MSTNKKIKIAVLGSTGSIGKTSLKIISKHRKKFDVSLLSCDKNFAVIFNQIKKFKPLFAIVSDKKAYNKLLSRNLKNTLIFSSLEKFLLCKKNIIFDKTILGISGTHGLDYAFSFVKISKKILLANKETIVCGGNIFIKQAKKSNCLIEPLDSEHYCLKHLLVNINLKNISSIYITASGGPFLKKNYKDFYKAKIKDSINHPNWAMGNKISVDSATMVNKILEVIEASVLFDLNFDIIKIKIHEESKVHAAVSLKNGLTYMLAHDTSMEIPIRNSLFDGNFFNQKKLFFNSSRSFLFQFDEKNLKKFKIINSAYKIIRMGHRAHILFNELNDHFVNRYLGGKIFFYEISKKLINIFKKPHIIKYCKKKVRNYSDIKASINYAKIIAKEI